MHVQYTALVLEGGGMRAIYTSGILDYFLEKRLSFENIVGVSAGSGTAMSYVSRQGGFYLKLSSKYGKRTKNIGTFIAKGNYFDLDFLYKKAFKIEKFNYDELYASQSNLHIGVFDIVGGSMHYYNQKDFPKGTMDLQIASSALPIISKPRKLQGKTCFDGGIVDSIPINYAQMMARKQVVILTNPPEYIREMEKALPLIKIMYRNYPKLIEAMSRRHTVYNETVKYVERLAAEGTIYLIRPEIKLPVSRYTTDMASVKCAYDQGFHDAHVHFEGLMKFLKEAELDGIQR